jgi:AraC family transcriptional regulator of arabinose operon
MSAINHKIWKTVSSLDQKQQILGIGVREPMNIQKVYRPLGTQDWLLMSFEQAMTLGTPQKPVSTICPSIILWPPNTAHYYSCYDKKWIHSWIHFKGELWDKHLSNWPFAYGEPDSFPCHGMLPWLKLLSKELSHPRPSSDICEHLLKGLIYDIRRTLENPLLRTEDLLINAIDTYLQKNHREPIKLNDLAKTFQISVSNLCMKYKKAKSCSPMFRLREIRMEFATYHLKNTSLNISEIGCLVGYNDPYHFSKQFKEVYGTSPRQMRETWY